MMFRAWVPFVAASTLAWALVGCSGASEEAIDDLNAGYTASPSGTKDAAEPQLRIHRLFNGTRHFQTLDQYEGQARGFTLEADDVRVMQDGVRGASTALYRCLAGGLDHFLSPDSACEGARVEGLLGWMFPDAVPGTIPLYRCFNGRVGDHFSTTRPDLECTTATGFHREGLLGYLPGSAPFPFLDDQQHVYRLYNGGSHLLTLSSSEGLDTGYVYERAAFRTLRHKEIGADRQLFRCVQSAGLPFLSIDSDCEGHGPGRSLGWIFPSAQPETAAVTRCVHPAGTDHLATTNAAECVAAGYHLEGVLGFVPVE